MQQNNNRKPTKAQGTASANAKGKQEECVSAAKQENAAAVSAVKQVEQAKAKTVSAKKKTVETKTAANRLKAEQAQAERQKKQAEITAERKKAQADKAQKRERTARRAEKRALKEEKRKEKIAAKKARKAKMAREKAAIKAEKSAKKAALKKERAILKKKKAMLKKDRALAHAEKEKAKQEKARLKAERIAERKEKAQLRAEQKRLRKEEKKKALAEKAARRKNATERKHQEGRKRRKERDPHEGRYLKTRGLTAAVIALGVTTLALASALTVYRSSAEGQIRSLEGFYARAFTDLIGSVDEINSDLSKLSVTTSPDMERSLAVRLIVGAERAENSISELPLPENARYGVAALINRIGSFAKYLEKTAADKPLTQKQRETATLLAEKVRDLQTTLYEAQKQTGNKKFRFSSLIKEGGPLVNGFEQMGNPVDSLPKLIFDGPFSEGTSHPHSAPSFGKELDRVAAESALTSAFSEYGLRDVAFLGEGSEGPIAAYSFTAKDNNGGDFYAQISKMGGKVVLFDSDCGEGEIAFSDEVCIEKAAAFLSALGYGDVTPVWTDSFQSECTVNFAAEENGVVLYPDLIKVKVCKTDGRVMGMEAFSYLLNHKTRSLPTPKLSEKEAENLLSSNLTVNSSRICLVPLGFGKEELCYEFAGTANGQTYYVYLSALTGKDVQIFRVVEGTEGTLLS